MISDIIENQQDTCNNYTDNMCIDNNTNTNTTTINTTNTNVLIPLSKDNHENIYNFLVDEIKIYKQTCIEKDQQIKNLNNKIDELIIQLNDLESKLNKMNNINLLIKLKENLTNKKNDFISENNNIDNNSNSNSNSNSSSSSSSNSNSNSNSNDNLSLSLENSKSNIIIENTSENTSEKFIKPIKRKKSNKH